MMYKKDDIHLIQTVRDIVSEHPEFSMKKIAQEARTSQGTVRKIIKSNDIGYQSKRPRKNEKVCESIKRKERIIKMRAEAKKNHRSSGI